MKSIYTENLENRLLKYSLAAGAVLFGAKVGNAQVIYTNPADQINVSEFSIDFNGDGTIDLDVKAYPGPHGSVARSDIDIATGKVQGYNRSLYHLGSALNSSISIGPSKNFSGTFQNLVYSSYGQWPGKNQKFLGVKFTISGQTHYGWVRLSCSSTAPYKLTVYDYAYQATANTAISSGALPVELTTFTANNLGDKVELKWNTATEVNNYGFNIERKPQAGEWTKIGFIKGNGNSNSPKNYSFVDESPVSGKVEYRLKQIDNDGKYEYSKIVEISSEPTQFSLAQNYPNPFNPTTTIQYAIPSAEHVTIKVYNEIGEEVRTLVDENKEAGQYKATFNGSGLASGIYYYRISAGNFIKVKKLMLLK